MKLVCKSFDGKIYDFEEEYLKREENSTAFKLFNSQGEPTTYYEDALLIYINSYNETVAKILEDNEVFFEGCPEKEEWWAYSDFHDAFVDVTVTFKIISSKINFEMNKIMGV